MTSIEELAASQQTLANQLDAVAQQLASMQGAQEQASLMARLTSGTPMRLGGFPAGAAIATAGSTEPGAAAVLAPGSVTAPTIAPGAITSGSFAPTIRAPIVWSGTLPALPDADYPIGSLIFLTDDGKLYRNVSDAWAKNLDGADLDAASVSGTRIISKTITAWQIAADTITANEIAADTITAGQIAVGAIGAAEIAAGAVTAEVLSVGVVSNAITNPGFETDANGARCDQNATSGITGWRVSAWGGTGAYADITDIAVWAASGRKYITLHTGTTGECTLESVSMIPVEAGVTVSGSAMLHDYYCSMIALWYDSTYQFLGTSQLAVNGGSGNWSHHTGTAIAPANARFCSIGFQGPPASNLSIDEVTLFSGGVTMDRSGVTISDGALTFQDFYGTTVMDGAGFGEAWVDFIHEGLYNGTFAQSSVADNFSRYWAPSNGAFAWSVVGDTGAPGGFAWRQSITSVAAWGSLYSDLVAVTGGMLYRAAILVNHVHVSGSPLANYRLVIDWFNSAKGYITSSFDDNAVGAANFAGRITGDSQLAPSSARYARVGISPSSGAVGAFTANIRGVVFKFVGTVDDFIPRKCILLWSGTLATIPSGWYLCDGSNGTPDLRDRFIIGGTGSDNGSGGSASATAALGHSITGSVASATPASTGYTTPGVTGSPNSTYTASSGTSVTTAAAAHTHDSASHRHTSAAHSHGDTFAVSAHAVQKWYRLAYIMKG